MERPTDELQPDQDAPAGDAGESACLAHLLCPECGVVLDGSPHRPDCTAEPR